MKTKEFQETEEIDRIINKHISTLMGLKINFSKNELKKLAKIRRKHQYAYEEEYKKLLNKIIMHKITGKKTII